MKVDSIKPDVRWDDESAGSAYWDRVASPSFDVVLFKLSEAES